MSHQKWMIYKEFRQRSQTEEAFEAYLFEQRWPDGFVCPKCEGRAVTNCADAGNMSANTAADKAQSRRGLFCTARIFL